MFKSLLACIVCHEICIDVQVSLCCESLACLDCSVKLISSAKTCSICNSQELIFQGSLALKKIIDSIIISCPDCKEISSFRLITDHIQSNHPKSKNIRKFKSKELELISKGLFKIHQHELNICSADINQIKCYSRTYLKCPTDCTKLIDVGSKYYSCNLCRVQFCLNCINKQQTKFFTSQHDCPLDLLCTHKGFICNGPSICGFCFSGNPTSSSSDLRLRYRCNACDFDLCGNCFDGMND